MKITIVIRFSSLGDIAILIPSLYTIARENQDDIFLVLTKKNMQNIFVNRPKNILTFGADTECYHKGIFGLFRLISDVKEKIKEIKADYPSQKIKINIADMHDVIRSKIIKLFFPFSKRKTILKERKEKRALCRVKNKKLKQLKTSHQRYKKVFRQLGYKTNNNFRNIFYKKTPHTGRRIGIAPFASFKSKTYPLPLISEVINILSKQPDTRIYIFGNKKLRKHMEKLARKHPNTESTADRFPFRSELALMNTLDVMISMDSANMHFASLVNTPVISIFGSTHPYAGFYGYRQKPENIIQLDLECRPCSIYGTKKCREGTYACLKNITPEMIVEKIEKNIYKKDTDQT
ncbi:MAG: glycosyltransferase family 9 protein [Dysgonamonadaceae bacterium]|jgi:ADP-heptose:LPS heptosyltransferase|nr:glycosyltransferase family 9 protein [Dysgonamonadaceae bacterium]